MDYQIDFQKYISHFAIPTCVTEDLPQMKAEYLKVILQILQTPAHNYSSMLLSSLLEIPEQDVIAALQYWESKGLLSLSGSQTVSAPYLVGKKAEPVAAPSVPNNEEIAFLLSAAESILGKPITSQERNTLLQVCNVMNMPADIVVMILQYCCEIGNRSIYAVEKICAEWAKEGITTHERAEEKLKILSERDSIESNVARCLKINGRALSKSQAKYAHSWVETMGFTYEMIEAAYDITVNNTGGLSLPYMNRVLENWSRDNVRTPEALKNYIAESRKTYRKGTKTSNGTAPSYSRDELEDYWNKN